MDRHSVDMSPSTRNIRENSLLCTLPDSPGNRLEHNGIEIPMVGKDPRLVRARR